MAKKHTEYQKTYFNKFTRPTVQIPKDKYILYKDFINQKGYDSVNQYVNAVFEYDLSHNVIPCKKDVLECYKPKNTKDES